MRNDLYPFSVTPRDLAPRERAAQTLAAPSKGMVFGHAAAPPMPDSAALVPPSRQQIPAANPPIVGGEAAPG
jgi:hypothetical protein